VLVNASAVRTQGLTKRYGPVLALDRLDLEVHPGEVFGFLGPNGAGKSTTMRLLLGLARATPGRAWIFDTPAEDVERAHRLLAHVPADVALWPRMTGAEILGLLGSIGPEVDLGRRRELADRLALDVGRLARTYSSGNRQKVALVAAFATEAPLLLLDEPTSGLDPLAEREFRRIVDEARDAGRTVFLSSHQLGEVDAVCDRVGILRAGRLVEVSSIVALRRRLRRTELDVTYDGPAPDLDRVPGVDHVERPAPGRLTFSVTGSPGPALAALATVDVRTLDAHEPSIEELFLSYYGQGSS
jgi:ABC-2 type transport system ATP-binding protein